MKLQLTQNPIWKSLPTMSKPLTAPPLHSSMKKSSSTSAPAASPSMRQRNGSFKVLLQKFSINERPMRNEFPIFDHHPELIYLDSAATAHKPRSVIDALTQFYSS